LYIISEFVNVLFQSGTSSRGNFKHFVMLWLRELIVGLSLQRSGFSSGLSVWD